MKTPALLLLIAVGLTVPASSRADRIVLAPRGETLAPNTFRTEFTISPRDRDTNLIWLQLSTPDGIEMEIERADIHGDHHKRHSFNIQYPFIPDVGKGLAVSLGVRDLFGTGIEREAIYAVASHPVRLSDRQFKLFRAIQLDAGLGTGALGGPFAGIEARLTMGLDVRAELFRRRFNLALSVPLGKSVRLTTQSLNGTVYYGFSFGLTH